MEKRNPLWLCVLEITSQELQMSQGRPKNSWFTFLISSDFVLSGLLRKSGTAKPYRVMTRIKSMLPVILWVCIRFHLISFVCYTFKIVLCQRWFATISAFSLFSPRLSWPSRGWFRIRFTSLKQKKSRGSISGEMILPAPFSFSDSSFLRCCVGQFRKDNRTNTKCVHMEYQLIPYVRNMGYSSQ